MSIKSTEHLANFQPYTPVEGETCSICYTHAPDTAHSYGANDKVKKVFHIFCRKCLEAWLKTDDSMQRCPICRIHVHPRSDLNFTPNFEIILEELLERIAEYPEENHEIPEILEDLLQENAIHAQQLLTVFQEQNPLLLENNTLKELKALVDNAYSRQILMEFLEHLGDSSEEAQESLDTLSEDVQDIIKECIQLAAEDAIEVVWEFLYILERKYPLLLEHPFIMEIKETINQTQEGINQTIVKLDQSENSEQATELLHQYSPTLRSQIERRYAEILEKRNQTSLLRGAGLAYGIAFAVFCTAMFIDKYLIDFI